MKRTLSLAFTATPLSNPTPGAWCSRCLLPSGVTCTVALELDHRPWQVTDSAWCLDCGEEL